MSDTVQPTSDPGIAPPPNDDSVIVAGVVPTAQAVLGTPTSTPVLAGGRRRESGAAIPVTEAIPQATVEAAPVLEQTAVAPPEQAPVAPEIQRSSELSPELEKFVEQTEKHGERQPGETVISAQTLPENLPKTVKKPVVILPMTQKHLQSGRRATPANSVRWLAEWCIRQIKKFQTILVVYRENE